MAKAASASKKESTGGEVVPLRAGSSAVVQMDEAASALYGEAMGAGQSDAMEDRGTPLLYIAQRQTPQIDKNSASFVPGLEAGMAFNSLTGQFWADTESEGVPVLPCYFRKSWLEWVPRAEGGGFRGAHPFVPESEVPEKFPGAEQGKHRGIYHLASGNDILLTHQYFCILPETLEPIVVPMASSNLKASTQMQALINARVSLGGRLTTPPAFLLPWRLRSVYATNDQGSWYRWAPQRLGSVADRSTWTDQVYGEDVARVCVELFKACSRGDVRVAQPMSEHEASADDADRDDVPV